MINAAEFFDFDELDSFLDLGADVRIGHLVFPADTLAIIFN